MSDSSDSDQSRAPRSLVIAAFAAIYLIWGSTYLGIRFAIETLPPFLMAGSRFLLAGIVLYALARIRSGIRPTGRQWRDASAVGVLLLAGGNGGVTWAEHTVPTVIAALLVAVTPLWMAIMDWLRPGGVRPKAGTFVGLAVGLAGVALIIAPTGSTLNHVGTPAGLAVLILASLCWAFGSVWSKHTDKPASPFLTVGMQMLAGGVALTLMGLASGETAGLNPANFSFKSIAAWAYLVLAGSFIGFTAYIWLLQVSTPARVGTYAYVNPVIAVTLGVTLGGETLSGNAILGAVLVVLAVILILRVPAGTPRRVATEPPALPGVATPVRESGR